VLLLCHSNILFLQPDMALPVQPPDMLNGSSHKAPLSLMHDVLHEEIEQFCKQVAPYHLPCAFQSSSMCDCDFIHYSDAL
jgi:hypothetical protein